MRKYRKNESSFRKKYLFLPHTITLPMKNPTFYLLLELLGRLLSRHSGLDSNEEIAAIGHPSPEQWSEVIGLSEQMQVSELLYDAVSKLGPTQRPDNETMMRWTARVVETERSNRLYRHQLYSMFDHLTETRVTPIVMKGITLANLYPNPEHRPVGDVDLFVPLDVQHTYIKCFEKLGAQISSAFDLKHLSLQCLGMNWELHFRSIRFYSQRTDRRYGILEAEETSRDSLFHETFDNHKVAVFPPILNLVYLTAHLQHHLLVEQANLRQIIDWMFALQHDRTALAIKEQAFVNQLKKLGLYRLYRCLGAIAVNYLGLSADSYAGLSRLTKLDKKRGEYLLKIILQGRVPGGKPYEPRLDSDTLLKRLGHFAELTKRCFALRGICPRESLATPFGFIYHAIRRRLRKK